MKFKHVFCCCLLVFSTLFPEAQKGKLAEHNLTWTSQSKNSGESMPVGGGDIGLNVWVEKDELFFYMSRSGAFDENNMFPKLGRVRVRMSPNPFESGTVFRQELNLAGGYIRVSGKKGNQENEIMIWVDVFRPVIHVDITGNKPVSIEAVYESWRAKDRELLPGEKQASSYKWAKNAVTAYKDSIRFGGDEIVFYHQNRNEASIFERTVEQQGLSTVKAQLFNPLKDLLFGGLMRGSNLKPAGMTSGTYMNTGFTGWALKSSKAAKKHQLAVFLHVDQAGTPESWFAGLQKLTRENKAAEKNAFQNTEDWWKQFWQRSFVFIDPGKADEALTRWQVGRNYQLFRYMLACNAFGKYPTKFNGGLFTYDPVLVDPRYTFTPDHRQWGGGTFTAQNQRLVYWPMLKSGDFDMMPAQFDFYLRLLQNAELRTMVYWGHRGASFTEQIENFGLPNYAEYGLSRPEGFDPGLEYNAWLEYHWDSVLEFCLMILDAQQFTGQDISKYLPLIESSLVFFDEHYQYRATKRGIKKLDQDGHLVLYPGTAAETFKMANNSSSTIAGLQTVLQRLLHLPATYADTSKRNYWQGMLKRIPPITFREMQGYKTIAPAKTWERMQNTEIPQLYPVFPYSVYGIGKPDLDIAINTWKYDTDAIKNRNHTSWHQDNIFCARLGLTEEAAALAIKKLQNSGRRFPAFWGPGHDYVPDHNWGGSGMIGVQEMLLQADKEKIWLFPAWPKDWDVHFKLHAPLQTTVEGILKNGKLELLEVIPASRKKDIEIMLK